MKKLLTFAVCASLLLVGCKDDENDPSGNNPNPNTTNFTNPFLSGSSIQTSFIGRITNTSGQPINGAVVQVGAALAISNTEGFYNIPIAAVDREYAAIKVSATGHFQQVRSIKPRQGHTQMNDIQLIPRITVPAFSAESGGEVSVSGGGKVTFPANALVKPDGSAYTGQVSVATAYLDPTDMELPNYMPGSLAAVNAQGEGVGMITYGMIGLEMYGTGGQALQLASGQSATIEFPVQAAQMSHAPERIPLWFFDENGGLWYEEGFADKAGDVYVGTVSHFTFWNCDVAAQTLYLEGTLKDNAGMGIAGLTVQLVRPNGAVASTMSNAEGYFSGIVPANEILTLKVFHPDCGPVILYEEEIGPFSSNTNLGILELDLTDLITDLSFTGTLVDCDEQALADYFITYAVEGAGSGYVITEADGSFNIPVLCVSEGNIELIAFNFENFEQSNPFSMDFNEMEGTLFDFGDLSFCEGVALERYFTYEEGEHSIFFPWTGIQEGLQGPDCILLNAGMSGQSFDSTAANIYFIMPSSPGPASSCLQQNHFISYYFADELLNYSGWLSDLEIIITDFAEEDGNYTLVEGTYSGQVEVFTYSEATQIENSYTSTASGSFRYVP